MRISEQHNWAELKIGLRAAASLPTDRYGVIVVRLIESKQLVLFAFY